MIIKKILITCFLFLLITANTNAQSRENTKMAELSSKSEKLTKATGWEHNKETGEWIKNKNVIHDKKCKSYCRYEVSQNFKWIQFSTITTGGEKYYVLLYEKLASSYKYPNIREGWQSEKQTHFFILTTSEYENLNKQVNLKSGEDIKITSKMKGYITNRFKILGGEHLYNEENLIAKINNTIKKGGYSEVCFMLNSQLADGEEVVRFRLPESCYYAGEDMKIKYFEVKATNFKTILIE